MRFTPCIFEKDWHRPITPLRLKHAEKHLAKQRDKVALFPDLAPTETPVERLTGFQEGVETIQRGEVAARPPSA